jgi:hypothetical protein
VASLNSDDKAMSGSSIDNFTPSSFSFGQVSLATALLAEHRGIADLENETTCRRLQVPSARSTTSGSSVCSSARAGKLDADAQIQTGAIAQLGDVAQGTVQYRGKQIGNNPGRFGRRKRLAEDTMPSDGSLQHSRLSAPMTWPRRKVVLRLKQQSQGVSAQRCAGGSRKELRTRRILLVLLVFGDSPRQVTRQGAGTLRSLQQEPPPDRRAPGHIAIPIAGLAEISSSPIQNGAFMARKDFFAASNATPGPSMVDRTKAKSSRPSSPNRSPGRSTSARSDAPRGRARHHPRDSPTRRRSG